jgi:hypothetical protein
VSKTTRGTQIYVAVPNTSAGWDMVKIGCPTSLTGLGGAAAKLDDTCLDDEEMAYSPGMPDPGPVSIPINFDQDFDSHRLLRAMYRSQEKRTFIVGASDGKDIPPTVNGSGVITYPSTRTFFSFEGYVADFPIDFAVNSLQKSNLQVQRSGPVTDHYKVIP